MIFSLMLFKFVFYRRWSTKLNDMNKTETAYVLKNFLFFTEALLGFTFLVD